MPRVYMRGRLADLQRRIEVLSVTVAALQRQPEHRRVNSPISIFGGNDVKLDLPPLFDNYGEEEIGCLCDLPPLFDSYEKDEDLTTAIFFVDKGLLESPIDLDSPPVFDMYETEGSDNEDDDCELHVFSEPAVVIEIVKEISEFVTDTSVKPISVKNLSPRPLQPSSTENGISKRPITFPKIHELKIASLEHHTLFGKLDTSKQVKNAHQMFDEMTKQQALCNGTISSENCEEEDKEGTPIKLGGNHVQTTRADKAFEESYFPGTLKVFETYGVCGLLNNPYDSDDVPAHMIFVHPYDATDRLAEMPHQAFITRSLPKLFTKDVTVKIMTMTVPGACHFCYEDMVKVLLRKLTSLEQHMLMGHADFDSGLRSVSSPLERNALSISFSVYADQQVSQSSLELWFLCFNLVVASVFHNVDVTLRTNQDGRETQEIFDVELAACNFQLIRFMDIDFSAASNQVKAFHMLLHAGNNIMLIKKCGETLLSWSESNHYSEAIRRIILEYSIETGRNLCLGFSSLHSQSSAFDPGIRIEYLSTILFLFLESVYKTKESKPTPIKIRGRISPKKAGADVSILGHIGVGFYFTYQGATEPNIEVYYLFLCLVSGGDDTTIKVREVATGTRIHILEGHQALIYEVFPHFKINVHFVFSTYVDEKIQSWLYDSETPLFDYKSPKISCAAISYNTATHSVGSACEDGPHITLVPETSKWVIAWRSSVDVWTIMFSFLTNTARVVTLNARPVGYGYTRLVFVEMLARHEDLYFDSGINAFTRLIANVFWLSIHVLTLGLPVYGFHVIQKGIEDADFVMDAEEYMVLRWIIFAISCLGSGYVKGVAIQNSRTNFFEDGESDAICISM